MLLGVHVPTGGKIYEAFDRAERLGCNTIQIFARNPQSWRKGPRDSTDVEEYNKSRLAHPGIKPVFIHIPYLINLASPDPKLYYGSVKAFVEDMLEAEALQADYIVSHMGSHKDTSEEKGLGRLIAALNKILAKTAHTHVKILLENTAGSGSWLGYKFSHQKKILRGIEQKERVGLCIDTAHAYLAGYNVATPKGLERTLSVIDTTAGLDTIKLIHLNDARNKFASHRDVHEHIGKGKIGLEGIGRIINHPRLRDLPFILETPKESEADDLMNLETVMKLRKDQ